MGLTNKQLILAKIETTYGTDASPTNALNAIKCGNLNITPLDVETVERNVVQPFFGANQKIIVSKKVSIDFEVELAGSGTAGTAPHYGVLMKACAFAETIAAGVSVTYNPITLSSVTQAGTSVSIYFQRDGIKHVLLGARGSFSIDLTVKTLPKIKFNFIGLLGTITDSALSTTGLAYVSATPVAVSSTNTTPLTFYGFAPTLESFTIDVANDVKQRILVGSESVIISDRAPKGTLKIESPALATKDFFNLAQTSTLGTFSVKHGQSAGNIVTFSTHSQGMAIEAPKYATNEGVDMLDMSYSLIPSATGNDELTITLT